MPWWEWKNPFEFGGSDAPISRSEFTSLVKRVADLERDMAGLQGARQSDQIKWYHAGDFQSSQDLASITGAISPWVSTVSRITGELTSASFGRQTWGDAILMSVAGGLVGGGVALSFELPWTLLPIGAGIAFALSGVVLVVHRRAMLDTLVKRQGGRGRKRQELDITVTHKATAGYPPYIERLLVAGVTTAQLKEFAPVALKAHDMGFHQHSGGGKLFSQPQYSALMAEMLKFGYASEARGNVPRMLTDRGREVMERMSIVL